MHTTISVGGARAQRSALGSTASSSSSRQGRCVSHGPSWAIWDARPGRRTATRAASDYTPAPSEDPVDKFIHQARTYVRHPGRAISDFASFALDSCRLMAHVSKPSLSETFKTAVIVLVVVALFVGLLHASNVGLLTFRSVGAHLLHQIRPR